jgi:hypothetical protein
MASRGLQDEIAIKQYCGYMEGIKHRIAAIQAMGLPPIISLVYGEIQVESIFLQFRKILELIAMGSLLNNKAEYVKARADFAKDWNARRIVGNLLKVNPQFYPQAVTMVGGEFKPRPGGLTQEEFIQLYDRCGEVLHTANPFGAKIDYKQMSDSISGWLNKVIALLDEHQLHMTDDDGFWLVQMLTDAGPRVRYSRFELVAPAKQ